VQTDGETKAEMGMRRVAEISRATARMEEAQAAWKEGDAPVPALVVFAREEMAETKEAKKGKTDDDEIMKAAVRCM
jgi:hypothetical protein